VKGAESKGHEVRRVNLGEVAFDPILHKGYKVIQELEPGLKEIQGHILWADHFVVVYPNWWNTMPALLKGFFDRAWLPGFAFNFDKVNRKIIKRLAGKTARVIIAAGTNSGFITWWKYGDYKNEIQRGILEFSGFNPVEISTFGPCDISGDAEKNNWISEAYALGEKGA
jgi:putative NADPH-quinone reductase